MSSREKLGDLAVRGDQTSFRCAHKEPCPQNPGWLRVGPHGRSRRIVGMGGHIVKQRVSRKARQQLHGEESTCVV